ncbi:radical SAM family heme chaperone HemW [Bacteroidia bacterium]|nr:radical SAM family heme chaperone HemW [Bacteroidia bacterium]
MAGIYIHIPFCKKACFYCDFHFSVSFQQKDEVVASLIKELKERKNFIGQEEVKTIYFGGGTPSVLNAGNISEILKEAYAQYTVNDNAEITFECNPDDLSKEYLKGLKECGVNRLSIGIQSLNDESLTWMNRSHNVTQALQAIDSAAALGFRDMSIDLIYGIPMLTEDEWRQTLKRALAMPINHLSAYSLTLEENTPYNKLVQQKKYKKPNDDEASRHFEILLEEIKLAGWENYEVSNFCKAGNYSKHNTAYWQNVKYLGIGPSAHSFDGKSRHWNVRSNKEYIQKIQAGESVSESEELSTKDIVNEALLTGLRTKWGVNLAEVKEQYEYDIAATNQTQIMEWQQKDWLEMKDGVLRLRADGFLFADYIASELFVL